MQTLFERTFGKPPEQELGLVRECLESRQNYEGFIRSNMSRSRLDLMVRIGDELRAEGWTIKSGIAICE